MILAGPIAGALGPPGEVGLKSRLTPMIAALFALVLIGLRLATPLPRVDGAVSPIAALAAVPADVRSQPVLNQYGFGGYLIWSDIKPFIDSRAELYKDEGLGQYADLTDGDAKALDDLLASQKIGWTIFAPEERINALLDAKPDWRRLYADRFAVVHVRRR